jgi:NAD(P)-dependent dehydrogenase (short-subunit alcohol dehydrogenase family)
MYLPLLDSELRSSRRRRVAKEKHAATVEKFERMMAVNVRSTMMCYKYAAKQMIAQGRGGRILGYKISYLCFATTY